MLARVARWEGADPQTLQASAEEIRRQSEAESGPPEGVPAKQLLLLHDTDNGRAMVIVLFDNEDDYREGDETLDSMSPPGGGMGRRVAVDKYEVAVQLDS